MKNTPHQLKIIKQQTQKAEHKTGGGRDRSGALKAEDKKKIICFKPILLSLSFIYSTYMCAGSNTLTALASNTLTALAFFHIPNTTGRVCFSFFNSYVFSTLFSTLIMLIYSQILHTPTPPSPQVKERGKKRDRVY